MFMFTRNGETYLVLKDGTVIWYDETEEGAWRHVYVERGELLGGA